MMAQGADRSNKLPVKDGDNAGRDLWLPVETLSDAEASVVSPLAPKSDPDSFPDPVRDESQDASTGYAFEAPNRVRRIRFRLGLILTRPIDWFRSALEREKNAGAAFLWSPVLLGLGSLIYFSLHREPLAWAFPVLFTMASAVAWKIRRTHWSWGWLAAVALLAAGASMGQWRAYVVDTVMLPRTVIGTVNGLVLQAEHRANGSVRYTLDVAAPNGSLNIRGIEKYPRRVRLTARKGGPQVEVGERIEGKARLGPSPGPSFPGAYDFSFKAWFDGIGASGVFLGKPEKQPTGVEARSGAGLVIAKVRAGIADVIRNALPDRTGGLAVALIVGDRTGIDEDTAEKLRRSGLAHILAISGLHMALVAVTVIFLFRGLLALFPTVTLNYPVRKWASFAALFAATAYLLISGANVSTQRAYIMVAIMLLAVLVDRRALTMRNVAIAAIAVLILAPEAVLTPGFQMSFAAVAALVATFEVLTRRAQNKSRVHAKGLLGVARRFLVRDMGGLAMTSLVAGLATGMFAAFHFYRVAPFGLLANLLAMPLVSLSIMPLALISVLLMPFGLEFWTLGLMAIAMERVVDIAGWVATLEPQGDTGFVPVVALGFGTVSLLLVTILRTHLKLLFVPFAITAIMSLGNSTTPDLLVLENGKQIGIMDSGSGLRLLKPNADKFSTGMWRRAFDVAHLKDAKNAKRYKRGQAGKGFTCDDIGCSTQLETLTITHLKSTASLPEDCLLSDVLIIPFYAADACAAMPVAYRPIVIDRTVLARYGAHSLRVDPTSKTKMIVSRSFKQYPRPWTAHRFVE